MSTPTNCIVCLKRPETGSAMCDVCYHNMKSRTSDNYRDTIVWVANRARYFERKRKKPVIAARNQTTT